ncbi:MAG: hypothetical protein WCR72_13565 [Bacteroidota bacterium]
MAAIEKPLIKIQRIEICRNCQGAGYVEGTSHVLACYVCDGKGRVRVVKEIKITIETV